mmetsp:Transcript_5823/g.9460  ORF Transcript_5823/g.9460 Transcript_5823/m.9460 type:complete len:224 (+) Transcript_5823:3-674(+)
MTHSNSTTSNSNINSNSRFSSISNSASIFSSIDIESTPNSSLVAHPPTATLSLTPTSNSELEIRRTSTVSSPPESTNLSSNSDSTWTPHAMTNSSLLSQSSPVIPLLEATASSINTTKNKPREVCIVLERHPNETRLPKPSHPYLKVPSTITVLLLGRMILRQLSQSRKSLRFVKLRLEVHHRCRNTFEPLPANVSLADILGREGDEEDDNKDDMIIFYRISR